ncbi:hypothetical protein XNC1_3254 [Xenorhabdus nematophila ATCC 19061]|uniref:Uncharacterized protein n=1 Tax=Xenorhabdus nematophila (strain ATCC 19061 / DSM 3370 / CCUG 14189 / LMG 1036 / NCIMB 9965 / AN6) TaxID=406817 RepID=D3VLI0_XENNA|nr:hypothetical protein XNC1_3254 [Xenorhabdus nematophila ATCC 19061]CEK24124.1 hypothetical protein XNC2_3130 [Xenorhabdus nematophila AN6/1]
MNNIHRNEFGLSEELASLHAQIRALINTAHHTMVSHDANIYIRDTAHSTRTVGLTSNGISLYSNGSNSSLATIWPSS